MKMRIIETGEIEELTFGKNGIDSSNDIIAPASRDEFTWNVDDDIWEINASDFEWWSEYINNYDSDEQELDGLASEVSELGIDPYKIRDEVSDALSSVDMEGQHDAFQRSMRNIRKEYDIER